MYVCVCVTIQNSAVTSFVDTEEEYTTDESDHDEGPLWKTQPIAAAFSRGAAPNPAPNVERVEGTEGRATTGKGAPASAPGGGKKAGKKAAPAVQQKSITNFFGKG